MVPAPTYYDVAPGRAAASGPGCGRDTRPAVGPRLGDGLEPGDPSGRAAPSPQQPLTPDDALFCLPAAGGAVLPYLSLAAELAGDFTVCGLQRPATPAGAPGPAGLEELASAYLQAVRAAQPQGPYRLCGWSMGGLLAVEVARQLERSGAAVSLLALLDTAFPGPGRQVPAAELALLYAVQLLAARGQPASSLPPTFGSWPRRRQLDWIGERLGSGAAGDTRFAAYAADVCAAGGYHPRPVQAPALLVVMVAHVDTDHDGLLRPPWVGEVAAALRA